MELLMWRGKLLLLIVIDSFHVKNLFLGYLSIHGKYMEMFPVIKPTGCTSFSNLFLERNSTYFGQFLCPSSGVLHCTRSNGIFHTGLMTACEQDQDGTYAIAVYAVKNT
jgi:hypothetical protein